MNIETNYKCLSGSVDSSHFEDRYYSKGIIELLQERGQWPYEDGLYKMWVECKVVDKFTKNKLFGGRTYYFVLSLLGTTKELEVNEHIYYNKSNINKIRLYSEDCKVWHPIRNQL